MTEAKAQVAYALWRKKTIDERQGGASLRLVLSIVPLIVGWALVELKVSPGWYFLAGFPLALGALFAMVDNINADRVPSWDQLQRDYDYEVWQIEEEAKARSNRHL